MGRIRISVCMATYNGGRYLRQQLHSILPQLSPNDEVVISDDSSTDDTVLIARSFQDNRIRILANQTFRNPIFNFENAIRNATGEYIFLSDQDDVWMDGRISEMMHYLREYDLVVSDCKVVNEALQVITESYFDSIDARLGFFRNLIRTSPYIGCCMAFNSALAKKSLPFPPQIPMHDFWIAMIAEARFKIKLLRKPLLLYRRHGSNASPTAGKSKNSLVMKVRIRLIILRALLSRVL